MPLPRMPLDEALSQKRIFFGRNAIEIRGASDAETRFGAMLSIREYPAFSGPGSLDLLLKVPQFCDHRSSGSREANRPRHTAGRYVG
jgi:type IV secretion system protein VirB4